MSRVSLDVEGDNLFPFLSRLWCCCTVNIDSGESRTYTDVGTLLADAKDWTLICGHNLLGYDLWALRKCWDVNFTVGPDTFDGRRMEYADTLVWSRTLWPDRPTGHSIADWGEKLGMPKGGHTDFSRYSEEMRQYCEQDARICSAIYKELLKEKQ